jgi:Mce-associated membrane protein
MSPRRRVSADEADYFTVAPDPPGNWWLAIVAVAATLVMAAAITVSALMLISHERDRHDSINNASALGYVREFMTVYTSLDPFNANAYTDRIRSQATGDFAKDFTERQNEILIRVAQAEPTTGSVVEAGVQRWRDDGSVDILVATKISTKTPDGKSTIESGDRWVATAKKEGQQWKISQLIPVI